MLPKGLNAPRRQCFNSLPTTSKREQRTTYRQTVSDRRNLQKEEVEEGAGSQVLHRPLSLSPCSNPKMEHSTPIPWVAVKALRLNYTKIDVFVNNEVSL